jgi:integrase
MPPKISPQQAKKAKSSPPPRKLNAERRSREYLSTSEIKQLCQAARQEPRYGRRNETLILLMFRHALRASEAISLRWDQVDLNNGLLHVKRIKNGVPSTHPLRGSELRALRQLQRDVDGAPYVFMSERKAPLASRSVRHIILNAGINAGFTFPLRPHMLRHSTGFYLANKGFDTRAIQGYMGHKDIKNTVPYTQLSATRFNDFWQD